jgi:hypothetical protein
VTGTPDWPILFEKYDRYQGCAKSSKRCGCPFADRGVRNLSPGHKWRWRLLGVWKRRAGQCLTSDPVSVCVPIVVALLGNAIFCDGNHNLLSSATLTGQSTGGVVASGLLRRGGQNREYRTSRG